MIKKAIIIGNGYSPKLKEISRLQKNGFIDIFCADGAANQLKKLNVIPKYIIGDLDSIMSETYDFYKEKVKKIVKIKDQNSTDIEKCLNYTRKLKYDEIILLSCIGDRLDHSLGNISILLKYSSKIKLHLVHNNWIMTCFFNNCELRTTPDEIISFFSFNNLIKMTTRGLRYNLHNETIAFGVRDSTSNIAVSDKICINADDVFLLIRNLDEAIKNDFFK